MAWRHPAGSDELGGCLFLVYEWILCVAMDMLIVIIRFQGGNKDAEQNMGTGWTVFE